MGMMKRRLWTAAVLLWAAAPARAGGVPPVGAVPPAEGARPDMRLAGLIRADVGTPVRASGLTIGRVEGPLQASWGDTLALLTAAGSRRVDLARIDTLWVMGRATMRGARVGALTGSIGLGLFAGFVYVVGRSVCDTGTCDDYDAGENVLITLYGAAIGAGAGALIGAGIGSAIPRWLVRYTAPEPGAAGGPATGCPDDQARAGAQGRTHGIGGLALHAGCAGGPTDCVTGRALYTSLGLMAEYKGPLSLGAEMGGLVPGLSRTAGDPHDQYVSSQRNPLFHATGIARVRPGRHSARPYALAGMGFYSWGQQYLGYALGGGLHWCPPGAARDLEIEVRWHGNLQRLVEPCAPEFLSVSVGTRLARW
jgi:hypothetical protein